MATRMGTPARDEARHWLPSQGVDPAPLAELNAECLGLLALRAAEVASPVPLPPLLAALRDQWASLSAQAVRRLAAAPFTCSTPASRRRRAGWSCARAGSATRIGASRRTSTWLRHVPSRAACWSTAGISRAAGHAPRAWYLASTIAAVESLAACSLTSLEAAAERNADGLRPRWPQQHGFWRELLVASSAGADRRLHELLLGGIPRLAAETLAEHAP